MINEEKRKTALKIHLYSRCSFHYLLSSITMEQMLKASKMALLTMESVVVELDEEVIVDHQSHLIHVKENWRWTKPLKIWTMMMTEFEKEMISIRMYSKEDWHVSNPWVTNCTAITNLFDPEKKTGKNCLTDENETLVVTMVMPAAICCF